jgi:hypothetical protein
VSKATPKSKRAAARPAKRGAAKQPAKPGKRAAKAAKAAKKPAKAAKKPAAAKAAKAAKKPSKAAKKPSKPAKRAAKPSPSLSSRANDARWQKFVEQHGVVLASARGPVPSVAEAIAGEPIIGSWWSHAKAHAIFDALSAIDDSDDIRCFKLVDGKITFVHRRLWPALACLARAGALAAERVASIQQEHMPTGEHRTFTTPFPDWVPDGVARSAASLSIDDARGQLGPWA